MVDLTKKNVAERLSKRLKKEVSYAQASAVVDLMLLAGAATEVGNESRPTGTKGKPSKVYRLNTTFSLLIDAEDDAPVTVATEAPATPAVEAAPEAPADVPVVEVTAETEADRKAA
jgi:hypothetical protein